MNPVEKSSLFFSQGYSCSQAVLLAYAEQFGINLETAGKLSSGFGGGMGRMGRTCGAVSGALMVLGLYQGSSDASDKVAKEKIYALARSFQEEFLKRQGSLDCTGLIGVDITTPAGLAQAREEKRFAGCVMFVEEAARIVLELAVHIPR